jgi:hypothetical protein
MEMIPTVVANIASDPRIQNRWAVLSFFIVGSAINWPVCVRTIVWPSARAAKWTDPQAGRAPDGRLAS